MLDFFGLKPTADMLGHNLRDTIATDKPIRDAALFGVHGGQVNITDGRYLYYRAAANPDAPLNDYTLMPTGMRTPFTPAKLQNNIELADPFTFTKNCRTIKIRATSAGNRHPDTKRSLLYDLHSDPHQQTPITDPAIEKRLLGEMTKLMKACDAPSEQYHRLGLATT